MTQSTFQKELEGKSFKVFGFLAYEDADVLSAQSKALEAFEKEIKEMKLDIVISIAQKHFGKGGK